LPNHTYKTFGFTSTNINDDFVWLLVILVSGNEMKNKTYHTSEQLQNSNDNNREENDNPNTPCFFTLIYV